MKDMKEDGVDRAIVAALANPLDDEMISELVSHGQVAYDRIVSRIYPCPGVSHPQEGDDRMCNLVVRIARIDPSIILENITHKDTLARSRVVSAAMVAGCVEFRDLIIDRLRDRSIYVLDKAVWAIDRNASLRTKAAGELLKALLAKKVANRLCVPKRRIEEFVDEIERRTAEQDADGKASPAIA